ncbi:hypothetical protein [Maridesulfovibrio sp.]|uniref:hypothetical protein n=1 Tax=Maridesulfovibrio sp. TaxID=2795000 RepID=UPI003BAA6A76
MRELTVIFIALAFLSCPGLTQASLGGWANLPAGAATKIETQIAADNCAFVPQKDGSSASSTLDGSLQLNADNSRVRFGNKDNWFSLTLDSVGRAEKMLKAEEPKLKSEGTKLNLIREGMTEWYKNHGKNIEHGLVIHKKPTGKGELTFAFSTSGNLSPQQHGADILFSGAESIKYSTIKVWDAKGIPLPCSMAVAEGRLLWLVDDSKADYPLTIDPTVSFVKMITADTVTDSDLFGYSVAVSGEIAIVGAPHYNNNAGAAYIFYKDEGGTNNWRFIKKITASDTTASWQFGYSVAISGDIAIVGSPYSNFNEHGSIKIKAGAVYIFYKNEGGANNWGQIKKNNGYYTGDQLGWSVSISGDIAIGGTPCAASWWTGNSGIALIYYRNQDGPDQWGKKVGIYAPTAKANAKFGYSVAISGNIVVAGSPFAESNAGEVDIFYKDEGNIDNWGHIKTITASETLNFGDSVAISGDIIIAGAPGTANGGAAHIFYKDEGSANNWGEVKKITASNAQADAKFGDSVALSGDIAVVGAPMEDHSSRNDCGAAYIFYKDQGNTNNWGERKKVVDAEAQTDDHFGAAAAVAGDIVIVGDYNKHIEEVAEAGAAYIYDIDRTDPDKKIVPAQNQPSGTVAIIDEISVEVHTKEEITDQYNSVGMGEMLGSQTFEFTATVTDDHLAYFSFNSTSLGERRAGDVTLYKLLTDKPSLTFKYSDTQNPTQEGYFWITDEDNSGQYIDPNTILTGGRSYTINYSIMDNGDYDTNETHGIIHDPVVPGTLGSSGTGCTLNPQANSSMELAALFIIALLGAMLRLRKK